ncbi:Vacuolar protein-sorting-associated protein 33-like protein, partial [Drosera capensis]
QREGGEDKGRIGRPVEDILRLLPGSHSDTKRGGFSRRISSGSTNADKLIDGRRSLVLVVFNGGVTFAEISALRFLCAQEGMAYDIIIATTKVVSGDTLLDTFVEKLS